ncbi:TPA: ead/Ea22-like family protein [Citrobacter freundii]|nr:ead/Ea22-like family protein [Salmonella enterica subsp. enterica serovar London]ELF4152094.1 ead/Ea22-like family protein [Citrobacter freundii]ELS6122932.1 ead/Ea22-like family protein [Salmonella enterica subsp. enterica serovar London]HAT2175003.1 ead/Ea22-like family protein [Citrobacter freundii]HAT2255215.1 ead/Ea22-like family protein [Citrobacter freundii]
MTALKALRQLAEKAGGEEWQSRKEPGVGSEYTVIVKGSLKKNQGWSTCRPVADQVVNKKTMDFISAANPAAVLALLDDLEAAERRIAELEARTITVKFEPIPMEELGNRRDGKKHPYMFGAGYNSAVVHCESVLHQACDAAGIGVKGE